MLSFDGPRCSRLPHSQSLLSVFLLFVPSRTSARPFGPKTTSATTPTSTASGAPTPRNDAVTTSCDASQVGVSRRACAPLPCLVIGAAACSRQRTQDTVAHDGPCRLSLRNDSDVTLTCRLFCCSRCCLQHRRRPARSSTDKVSTGGWGCEFCNRGGEHAALTSTRHTPGLSIAVGIAVPWKELEPVEVAILAAGL